MIKWILYSLFFQNTTFACNQACVYIGKVLLVFNERIHYFSLFVYALKMLFQCNWNWAVVLTLTGENEFYNRRTIKQTFLWLEFFGEGSGCVTKIKKCWIAKLGWNLSSAISKQSSTKDLSNIWIEILEYNSGTGVSMCAKLF